MDGGNRERMGSGLSMDSVSHGRVDIICLLLYGVVKRGMREIPNKRKREMKMTIEFRSNRSGWVDLHQVQVEAV